MPLLFRFTIEVWIILSLNFSGVVLFDVRCTEQNLRSIMHLICFIYGKVIEESINAHICTLLLLYYCFCHKLVFSEKYVMNVSYCRHLANGS